MDDDGEDNGDDWSTLRIVVVMIIGDGDDDLDGDIIQLGLHTS